MKTLGHYAFSIGVATALLAGCSASQLPAANSASSVVPFAFKYQMTFHYTGKKQTFKIPRGVTRIGVIAVGGNGGGSVIARGGRVSAVIPVIGSETLAIYVGGEGTKSGSGFNGGGAGGHSPEFFRGYGGGGASDVRRGGDALTDRVIVAAGGGGQGGYAGSSSSPGQGGSGGARTGGSGKPGSCSVCGGGGSGGTQQQGGAGGASLFGVSGGNGHLGHGGVGGTGCDTTACYYPGAGGGGGGGGYYGGGGGGGGTYDTTMCVCSGGGGGGGSSYVEPSATHVHMERGWKDATGDGLVVLSW